MSIPSDTPTVRIGITVYMLNHQKTENLNQTLISKNSYPRVSLITQCYNKNNGTSVKSGYSGRLLEVLKTFPDKSVDLVLTDPPYPLFNKKGEGWNEWNNFYKDFYVRWITEVERVLKPEGGGLYIFWPGMLHVRDMFLLLGEPRQLLFWTKPFAMMVKNRKGWQNFTELIFWKVYSDDFYFNIGNKEKRLDYFTYTSSIHRKLEREHPTQKPQVLVEDLIRASSKEGDIILDPFIGSGTTCAAGEKHSKETLSALKYQRSIAKSPAKE